MTATLTRLSGEEWQRWANQLLTRRYGPAEYQKVPDNDRGDAGIEGYTLTDGHAYQAYGCEEPISTADRYEKQRNKITKDLNKFKDNKSILLRIFGNTRITRWVLFVPHFDSRELVAHAAKKTEEILTEALPYADLAFRVMIHDEEDFSAERDSLINIGCGLLDVVTSAASDESVQAWISTNDKLVETLDRKIAKMPTIPTVEKKRAFRDRLLKHFLEGQDTWEYLRRFPSTYEKLFSAKTQREKFLETSCMLHSGSNAELLREALAEFKKTIREETGGVTMLTAESLAWEAIADWMLRCPLDFTEEPNRA